MGVFQKGTMIPHGWTEKEWVDRSGRDTKEAVCHMYDHAKKVWAAKQNADPSPEQ